MHNFQLKKKIENMAKCLFIHIRINLKTLSTQSHSNENLCISNDFENDESQRQMDCNHRNNI